MSQSSTGHDFKCLLSVPETLSHFTSSLDCRVDLVWFLNLNSASNQVDLQHWQGWECLRKLFSKLRFRFRSPPPRPYQFCFKSRHDIIHSLVLNDGLEHFQMLKCGWKRWKPINYCFGNQKNEDYWEYLRIERSGCNSCLSEILLQCFLWENKSGLVTKYCPDVLALTAVILIIDVSTYNMSASEDDNI